VRPALPVQAAQRIDEAWSFMAFPTYEEFV